jgi:hypothetical protein
MPLPLTLARYEKNVAKHIAAWLKLPTHKGFLTLVDLLGCAPDCSAAAEDPLLRPPFKQRQLAVQAAWREILEKYDPLASNSKTVERYIFAGFLPSNDLRQCLETEQGASAFVMAAARYLGRLDRPWQASMAPSEQKMEIAAVRNLQRVLNAWLSPTRPTLYTHRSLAAKVFGDAWCILVLDSYTRSNFFVKMKTSALPPIMGGLIVGQSRPAAEPLPDLEVT